MKEGRKNMLDIDNLILELRAAYKPVSMEEIQAISRETKTSPKIIALDKEIEQGRAFLKVLNSLGV